MNSRSTSGTRVIRVDGESRTESRDVLATEDPLEIRLEYGPGEDRLTRTVSVTMRTPGHDEELAAGFLFTEGVIEDPAAIREFQRPERALEQFVKVVLDENNVPRLHQAERNFYTTSSCGVCGKASIASIQTVCPFKPTIDSLKVSKQVVVSLPGTLREAQAIFEQTGGLHGCALFDIKGNLIAMREDVGRHNALDKLIGRMFQDGKLPAADLVLLLSGRASFELVQKASMAGIRIVAAVGAPSSLAVELAEEMDITLIGFLRGARFNIYSGAERIVN